jgi:hypothetical protein
MIPSSGRSVAASSVQEARPQSGPPQPVDAVPRLVLPSAEQWVRWGAYHYATTATVPLISTPTVGTAYAAHWRDRGVTGIEARAFPNW